MKSEIKIEKNNKSQRVDPKKLPELRLNNNSDLMDDNSNQVNPITQSNYASFKNS